MFILSIAQNKTKGVRWSTSVKDTDSIERLKRKCLEELASMFPESAEEPQNVSKRFISNEFCNSMAEVQSYSRFDIVKKFIESTVSGWGIEGLPITCFVNEMVDEGLLVSTRADDTFLAMKLLLIDINNDHNNVTLTHLN